MTGLDMQAALMADFKYDPETGIFTRRVAAGRHDCWRAGSVVGSVSSRGYIEIRWQGKKRYGHRLAWTYMTGQIPVGVDHDDGDGANNRWANLREATQAQNMQNMATPASNTSGCIGVSWDKERASWAAYITVEQRKVHLGRFARLHEADAAYRVAKQKLHPFKPAQRTAV